MNYKKFFIGVGIAVLVLILIGFVFALTFSSERVGRGAPSSLPAAFELKESFRGGEGALSMAPDAPDAAEAPSPSVTPKKIIKNGSLTLVVDSTEGNVSTIAKLIEGKEGFVESSHVTDRGDAGKQASLTLRLPVASFSETMEALKALATLVEDERVSGQDVTEQFIDLEARLRNLKATEQQFLETLRRAFTIEDILKVQDRLSQVRSQIESLEGQLKYLANQTDLATINVTLSEEPTVTLSLRDFRPVTILKASVSVLVQGLIVLFNLLVQFVIVWIPLVLIGAMLLGILIWIVKIIVVYFKNKFSA